jgi:release factor glutamine methyltransferase
MSTLADNFNLNQQYSREIKSLLAFVCKKDLSWLLSYPEYQLTPPEESFFKKSYQLLITGTPLAYIVGEKSFYNYNFKVSPSVLIPRPETELIVDRAIEYLQNSQDKTACLDIGTGSGAIIVSVAAELQKISPKIFESCDFMAGDISSTALAQAKINTQAYSLENKINFFSGNLFTVFIEVLNKHNIKSLFIAANLPYLTPEERKREKSIKLEPDLALLGGTNGLDLYLKLLQQLSEHQDKFNFHLMMEINPEQAEGLIQLSSKYLKKAHIKKTSDLKGQTRFIELIQDRQV